MARRAGLRYIDFMVPPKVLSALSIPQVLAATARWVVVSKPSGMLTILGRGKRGGSEGEGPEILVDWVRKNYSSAWVVHRLDRETSGVVLFARSEEDHREANHWFQKRKMKKTYHCLSSGVPALPFFKITSPIEGSHSVTQVEVMEKYAEGFLARVLPRTGRRHQIRIHLAHLGFPIWGDIQYQGLARVALGGVEASESAGAAAGEGEGVGQNTSLVIPRVALHASTLELPTGEKFEAPFPADFAFWLSELRKGGHRV